ncbi:Oleate hydratase [Talaromyces islandicus]|uniref:Oleate hydratase n=1 Tax=Talaromyces islandicus TaxID=28573 RepID=A0A0U1MAN4_TALIS|nr:Oleate hydratase [Talaromyces islandicus]
MAHQQPPVLAPGHRSPKKVNAWILGSSIASLASAVHLICDAKVPASQIHILESHGIPGDGIISTEEIKKFNAEKPFHDSPGTHVLIRGDNRLEKMEASRFGIGLKDRMDLLLLMLKSEQALGQKRINELFNKRFFNSAFWIVLSTLFHFQPWHSAAEFRRCLRRYSYEFRSLNTKRILDCTRYNQYESIIVPIIRFLQNKGVDFRFRIKVTDIVTISDNGTESVTAINIEQNNSGGIINVCANDIVIVSIGSVTSGSSSGSNTAPALPPSMEAANELDENWSLWLDLGTKNPKFGNPYKFCTRVNESRLVTFTVTLNDAAGLFNRFLELTNDRPGSGSLLSLKHSNWMISLCIPHQPFFSDQPNNIDVLWGYGLYPSQEGNFVKTPMTLCNGKEIMTELLWHLDFPMEPILSNSITIPCVMPRMAAALLPRNSTDRPEVTPKNVTNLAIVGQFVEIADETTVSLDYSVRGAQLALSRLMGTKGPPRRRRAFHTPFSYFWR